MSARNLTCEEVDELVPEYVLGALSQDEAANVARHLSDCARHAESIAGYDAVMVGLAAGAPPVDPPDRLRQRLLQRVSNRPARRTIAQREWLGWAVAAVAVVAAVALGAWGLSLQRQGNRAASARAELLTIAADPDAQVIALDTDPAGGNARGVLIYTPESAAIWALGMPPLTGDQVYACWWIAADGTGMAGGTFRPEDGSGTWILSVPPHVEDFSGIAITLEPNSDVTQPSGPRVFSGEM